MGSSASRASPLAPTFGRMASWDVKHARRLLDDYKAKDLDFGLDAQSLAEIVSGDVAWAESIIDAFGGTNGIVNVLAFICGTILVASGAALEKANLAFDVMDFDMTEQISMDEMTITFLCCARGFSVMSGTGKVPLDEELENVTLQAYRELSKSGGQSITKSEFTQWVIRYIAAAPTTVPHGEVSLQDMAIQFGLEAVVAKSISEQVLSELAIETNNEVRSEEPVAQTPEYDVGTEAVDEQGREMEVEVQPTSVTEQDVPAYVEETTTAAESYVLPDHQHVETMEESPHQSLEEQEQQHRQEEEYGDEFQQETPRDDLPTAEPSHPVDTPDDQENVGVAERQEELEEAAAPSVEAEGEQLHHDTDGQEEIKLPVEAPIDVNAFDTYDYTQATYDGSSGLPPPDPFEDEVDPQRDPQVHADEQQQVQEQDERDVPSAREPPPTEPAEAEPVADSGSQPLEEQQ